MAEHFGWAVSVLHWGTHQSMTNALASMDLTASQGRILGYIARKETAPCSRDIEEAFHLSHPTVSGVLARLEKKGFIEFRPDENDRRCKRIYMMEKGMECTETMYRTIMENEEKMVRGFTAEETELFRSFLERSIENMGIHTCYQNDKEETTE